ncbi:MAG: hypothetical protein L0H54_12160 [Alcaligenaceae bacterium]|nr:hypothetical protein [Alcaligenaceae bacterium]
MPVNLILNSVVAVAALAVAILFRTPLTALMSTHMLVQIPLLVLAGVFAEQAWRARPGRGRNPIRAAGAKRWSYNEYGVPGMLLATLIGAYWMIPKALDDALVLWQVEVFKYLGLFLVGVIVRASVRHSDTVIKLFFLGNFCWMSAIVGMVYLDQPIRLCNAYLQGDQEWAGRGLIALAIILPSTWLLAEVRPIWRFLKR